MRTSPPLVLAAGALALATLVACSTGSAVDPGDNAGARRTSPLPPVEVETGLVHVHGLGVDPGDGVLYAATHSGLFRVPEKGPAERIANRAQDTMGFSVVGPGTFIGSGHPDAREDDVRPPLLGLIESNDAGQTWKRLSLHGKADFHTLAAAHGLVYGYDSTSSTFMVSSDKTTWDRRSRLPMRDFAVDPADKDRIVATTGRGAVSSPDGGRTWSRLATAPPLIVLSWDGQAGLFGMTADGDIHRSTDAGATWARVGAAGGEPEALVVDTRDGATSVYVAIADKGIVVSQDGGKTFATRYASGAT